MAEPIFRVKILIKQLSYQELIRSGKIPELHKFTPQLPSKKYPPYIYQLNREGHSSIYANFGVFLEEIIYRTISGKELCYSNIWSEISKIPMNCNTGFYDGIVKWIKPLFAGHILEHNVELTYKNIQGHPDLFCKTFQNNQTYILDVKTTGNFSKMAEESYLQILAYCALARICGYVNNYIGFILPLQRQIVWYDVSQWDHRKYVDVLLRESQWLSDDINIYDPQLLITPNNNINNIILSPNIIGGLGRYVESDIVGKHIRKEKIFDPKFKKDEYPVQIFLSNPQAKTFVSSEEITKISQQLTTNTKLYVHAPYLINLSSDDTWPVEHLRHEVLASQKIEAKGIVVHVGKYLKQDYVSALNKMEDSIKKVLEVATEHCPLMIETPAGQGTELCTDIEQFQSFYDRFGGAKNLKICIDSCHVYAAGYDPKFYIQKWLEKDPTCIGLVHFNDSETPRGSRVDRHYPVGLGYIGYRRLWDVHELCKEQHIPMVKE